MCLVSHLKRVCLSCELIRKAKQQQNWRDKNPEREKVLQRNKYMNKRDLKIDLVMCKYFDVKKFLSDLKMSRGCMDCGYNKHPHALDFDHVRGIKEFNVGIASNVNRDRLMMEIEKCEVVCANCHRIRTSLRPRNKKIKLPLPAD